MSLWRSTGLTGSEGRQLYEVTKLRGDQDQVTPQEHVEFCSTYVPYQDQYAHENTLLKDIGDWVKFCVVCKTRATPEHLRSEKHLGRAREHYVSTNLSGPTDSGHRFGGNGIGMEGFCHAPRPPELLGDGPPGLCPARA